MVRKEGQEDQDEVKEPGGQGPNYLKIPWSSWPSFWLFLGSLELPPRVVPFNEMVEIKRGFEGTLGSIGG